MKCFLLFIFFCSVSSSKPFQIPLVRIDVPLQGFSLGETLINTPKIQKTPQKALKTLLKSLFSASKYYISLKSAKNEAFLASISMGFSGFWLKDGSCFDCSMRKETPKCTYNCFSGDLFKKTLESGTCRPFWKRFGIPELNNRIKGNKTVSATFKIDCFSHYVTLGQVPLLLALETRNISFIQADGQFGLRADPKNSLDLVSLLFKRKNIDKTQFSLFLNPKDDAGRRTSFLMLGGGDLELTALKDYQSSPFDPHGFKFQLTSLDFNGQSLVPSSTSELTAELDIDKDYIGLPTDILASFLRKIPGTCDFYGKIIFCSVEKNEKNARISFFFKKNTVFSVLLSRLLVCRGLKDLGISNYCLLRVRESRNVGLGQPFFEDLQVLFDFEDGSVGFGGVKEGRIRNFVKGEEKATNWELLFYLSLLLILILCVILGLLMKKRAFTYSDIRPVDNLLNITTDQNDNLSVNNESFIGGDSFHFEYELPEIRKLPEEDEKLTPITKKHLFDKQQAENEKKEEKEIEKIEENQKNEGKNTEKQGKKAKNEQKFDNLNEEGDSEQDSKDIIEEIIQEIKKEEQNKENTIAKTNFEAQNSINQAEKAENSIKEAENPITQSETSINQAQNSIKEAENSIKEPENPIKEAENLIKEAENPIKEAENPIKEAENTLNDHKNPIKEDENSKNDHEKSKNDHENSINDQENSKNDHENSKNAHETLKIDQENSKNEPQNPIENENNE